jgi:hypothetical protein
MIRFLAVMILVELVTIALIGAAILLISSVLPV